MVPLSMTLSDL